MYLFSPSRHAILQMHIHSICTWKLGTEVVIEIYEYYSCKVSKELIIDNVEKKGNVNCGRKRVCVCIGKLNALLRHNNNIYWRGSGNECVVTFRVYSRTKKCEWRCRPQGCHTICVYIKKHITFTYNIIIIIVLDVRYAEFFVYCDKNAICRRRK